MRKSALCAFLASSVFAFAHTLYAGSNDNKTETVDERATVNWKLHIDALEYAAYADDITRSQAVAELKRIQGDGQAPSSRYLGLLWQIAYNPNPHGRSILFEKLELLTFAHYVWHAWGFTKEKSMEHQAAEKGQKTEWILRHPQEMRISIRIKMISQNPDTKHAADKERETAQKEHEAFKSILTAALKPIQTKLEANKNAVPTEFSAFWEKIQATNTMKSAERLMANIVEETPPKSADHDILSQLWEVYHSIWRSKE